MDAVDLVDVSLELTLGAGLDLGDVPRATTH